MKNPNNLIEFLNKYSFEDLAKSFFVLNLWLPNVASPIKSQLFYVILEAISNNLANEKQIKTYKDFEDFSANVISLLPSFPMLEDYVPETDWGEIKYFFNNDCYKIFYGGDLSNTYDWYYKFEILHLGFDDFYRQNIKRSPFNEFEFCLSLQDKIINGIPQSFSANEPIESGDFEIPSEEFWLSSVAFLDSFEPSEVFGDELVARYTKVLDSSTSIQLPTEEKFINLAHTGRNCFYFFLKKEHKIFPILPRKYFSVLFDTWGDLLNEFYILLGEKTKYPELTIGFEISKFIQQRVNEKNVFSTVSIINPDLQAHKTIFSSAFISKNKLVLIQVLPPNVKDINYEKILKELASEYTEIKKILSLEPVKIGLLRESKMVGFDSPDGNNQKLEPLFITCFPFVNTVFNYTNVPEDLLGERIPLEQLLGIFDEIENLDEITEFFDYKTSMQMTSPMSSDLDLFGSFKDSNSVLVRGAVDYTFIMIDPHWGSDFRYKSLSEFWKIYPARYSFGHPRSWSIIKDSVKEKSFLMSSKIFFGYVHVLNINKTTLFINSPVDRLDYALGRFTELLMDGLEDSFLHYEKLIENLPFAKNDGDIHILFFPNSLLENEDLYHLSHLSVDDSNWKIDITRLPKGKQGIRIVYNEIVLRNLLENAKDRTLQIELLLNVVQQLNTVFGDDGFVEIKEKLEKEKMKKNRYRIFSIQKKISFPDLSSYISPKIKEYKLADKEIAAIANNNAITEGKYEGENAKEKIRILITGLLEKINQEIETFNLKTSIPKLISNIDSLINEHEREEERIKNSLDQEVNYERDKKSGEGKLEFLHLHSCYRYLIEKFIQLQPQNNENLTDEKLAELLALVDRIIHLYSVSDSLHYGIYPAVLTISSDFFVETEYSIDITEMQKKWSQEQASLRLGLIGNDNDRNLIEIDNEPYLTEIDQSFETDLGFNFRDLISVQKLLSSWTFFDSSLIEATYYRANEEQIVKMCEENIDDFERTKASKILEFLTLDSKNLLLVEGSSVPAPDLPIWEHRKRTFRYSLRPLIKIENEFYWGAYSLERSGRTWFTTISNHKLPSDITVPNTTRVQKKMCKRQE